MVLLVLLIRRTPQYSIKALRQELAELLEDAKYDKLRSLPLYYWLEICMYIQNAITIDNHFALSLDSQMPKLLFSVS
jgi:hypothetical protein